MYLALLYKCRRSCCCSGLKQRSRQNPLVWCMKDLNSLLKAIAVCRMVYDHTVIDHLCMIDIYRSKHTFSLP